MLSYIPVQSETTAVASSVLDTLDTFALAIDGELQLETESISELFYVCIPIAVLLYNYRCFSNFFNCFPELFLRWGSVIVNYTYM